MTIVFYHSIICTWFRLLYLLNIHVATNDHEVEYSCLLFVAKSVHTRFDRASGRSRKKKPNFAGFSGANSRKKRPISREFRGNFRGRFH